jgi:hypothetical protein
MNLKLIKRVYRIKGEAFKPAAIIANFDKKIFYIYDLYIYRILITDFDFNFIKSVGSRDAENCQLDAPNDICFSSSKFYICETTKKRLQVFSKDFDFVTSYKVEYKLVLV